MTEKYYRLLTPKELHFMEDIKYKLNAKSLTTKLSTKQFEWLLSILERTEKEISGKK